MRKGFISHILQYYTGYIPTVCPISQLSADHSSNSRGHQEVITHCTPHIVQTYLHCTLILVLSIHQSQITLQTCCSIGHCEYSNFVTLFIVLTKYSLTLTPDPRISIVATVALVVEVVTLQERGFIPSTVNIVQ